jgi:hypothetical protein
MMSTEHEIRSHLADLLRDEVTLGQFEDWLISATWATESDLALELQLILAEADATDSDDRIIGRLAEAARVPSSMSSNRVQGASGVGTRSTVDVTTDLTLSV